MRWLIDGLIPRGKLTDIAGQMGQGKSLLTGWLAARTARTASVLLYSAEDDVADTIRPRLEAAGANLDRVLTVQADTLEVEHIRCYCEELEDVALVIVDPPTGYFPKGVDAWNTPQVRGFLRPHIELAQQWEYALVGIQHVNRRSDSDPLTRIADAQGIPQVARSVLIWGPDPDDEDGDTGSRKVLATAKNNLCASRPSAAFRIEAVQLDNGITAPRLVHLGESAAEAGDLVADQEARSQTQDAVRWLVELLADGEVEVEVAKKQATEAGITAKCLRVAKERVAIHSRPQGNRGPYVWSLRPAYVKKWASMGTQSNNGGVHKGNHEPWMPVDARMPTSLRGTKPTGGRPSTRPWRTYERPDRPTAGAARCAQRCGGLRLSRRELGHLARACRARRADRPHRPAQASPGRCPRSGGPMPTQNGPFHDFTVRSERTARAGSRSAMGASCPGSRWLPAATSRSTRWGPCTRHA